MLSLLCTVATVTKSAIVKGGGEMMGVGEQGTKWKRRVANMSQNEFGGRR
jgi:hypothetical protein